jgi:hypothetical protein
MIFRFLIPGWHVRWRAAAVHLLASLLVAAACAGLVFGLWYPVPYAILSGGVSLFLLVTGVDLILGPLLTLVAFDSRKTRAHLVRDLATIAALQIAALGYGLHTVYVARPVVLAAENLLFRVVAANEIATEELAGVKDDFKHLSITGPRLLGVRPAANGKEKMEAITKALEGLDGGARPSFWEDYEQSKPRVIKQLKAVDQLQLASPAIQAKLNEVLEGLKKQPANIGYLDVKARVDGWIMLVDRSTGQPLEFFRITE